MCKRKIIYALATFTILISYLLTGSRSMLILFLIMMLLPVISVIYTFLLQKGVSIKLNNMPTTQIRGEQLTIELEIVNTTYLPASNIFVELTFEYSNLKETETESFVVQINSLDKVRQVIRHRLEFTGFVNISTKKSYICDPLKLFKIPVIGATDKKVTIMPVLNEPDYYALYNSSDSMMESTEYSKKKKGEDTSEIFDVRAYANGDTLNKIHWKLSAKEDELLVKEFSLPISKSNCILVDLPPVESKNDRKNLDGIYELVYAIGNLACMLEKEFELCYYSRELEEFKMISVISKEELIEAVRLLICESVAGGHKALQSYLVSEALEFEKLFYITDTIDDSVFELEDTFKNQAYIYVVNDNEDAGTTTRLVKSLVLNVDRDDIAWGLSNTVI